MHKKFLSLILLIASSLAGLSEVKIPDEYKTSGFFVGCQAYTFNRFTVLEAIEKTAQAGGKVIEFYPGQRFSKDEPGNWSHDSSDEMVQKVKAQLEKFKIQPVNYGVVGIPKEEEKARKIFEFAKKMGLRAVTTESVEAIETIEKLVKEFDVMVAFHNHPKQPNNPNYKVWDPNYILSVVKDRDQRIGACADTGHWIRSGLNPVECIQILKGRVISSHMKDRQSQSGHDVPYGQGVGKINEVLEELRKQNFNGNISVEYEYNWDHSVPDVAQCIGFIRGYGLAKGWK